MAIVLRASLLAGGRESRAATLLHLTAARTRLARHAIMNNA